VGQAASLSGIDIALQSTEAGIDLLARGDQPMTAALTAVSRAYQAWQAGAADPQLADLNRGDVAAARALQADLGHVTPCRSPSGQQGSPSSPRSPASSRRSPAA
jgi:hypothetical protein